MGGERGVARSEPKKVGQLSDEIECEKQPDHHQRRNPGDSDEEKQNKNADLGSRKECGESAGHGTDRSTGSDHLRGVALKARQQPLHQCRGDTTSEIEPQKAKAPKSILDGTPEGPEKDHVEENVADSARIMQKHARKQGPDPLRPPGVEGAPADDFLEIRAPVPKSGEDEHVDEHVQTDQGLRDHRLAFQGAVGSKGDQHGTSVRRTSVIGT